MTLPPALLDELHAIFGIDACSTREAERLAYAYDNSRRNALPDAVAFAQEHDRIASP
jgi:D-lactate dehydrogenase